MRFRADLRPALALALAFSAGCARSDTVADRQIEEMRESIGKIEADQDRAHQKIRINDDASDRVTPPPSGRGQKPAVPHHTVQIGDAEDGKENDDPNDPSARPEIRLQGAPGAASSRSTRSKSTRRGEARIEPAEERDLRADGPRSSALDPDAKKAYDAALAQVNARQYDRALEALGSFLTRWPDHPYVENALYWRGESYYARGEFLRAAEQFEAVLGRAGSGNKAPDALLKIGMCHERLGASDRAKEYWDRLRREYPRSDAAKKIPQESR